MKKLLSIFAATVLSVSAYAQSPKFNVNFIKTKQQIKGTWGDWSPNWVAPTKSTYIQISMITENRVYNIRYYENNVKVRDIDVSYNDTKTKSIRSAWDNQNVWCYKINDSNDDWVFLKGPGAFGDLYRNPQKWMSSNDASIYFMDDEKFPGKWIVVK